MYLFFFKLLKAPAEVWLIFLRICDHQSGKGPITQWPTIEISLGHSAPLVYNKERLILQLHKRTF